MGLLKGHVTDGYQQKSKEKSRQLILIPYMHKHIGYTINLYLMDLTHNISPWL